MKSPIELKLFWTKYYGQLIGSKVVGFRMEDEIPVLIFEGGKNMRVEVGILCDEEGNGPGFLDSLPHPTSKEYPVFKNGYERRTVAEATRLETCGECGGREMHKVQCSLRRPGTSRM